MGDSDGRAKSDVVVIGGGMVGAATALGLAQAGFSVTVVENRRPRPFDPSQPPDLRISAISASSVALLDSLGVWKDVRQMRSAAYRGLKLGSGMLLALVSALKIWGYLN